MLLLKLAIRNLTRHRARTFLNLTMVIGAFATIILFLGFANNILSRVEKSITQGQGGHFQIAKSAVWTGDTVEHKEDAFIEDAEGLSKKLQAIPGIQLIGKRTQSYTLLFHNNKSRGALALGYDPMKEPQIEKTFKLIEGQHFSRTNPLEVMLSSGLSEQLNAKPGDTISIYAQTLKGSMNALDVEVRGVFKTGLVEYDNLILYIPLESISKLLSTQRTEKLALILNPEADLVQIKPLLTAALKGDSQLIVKDWKETATFFKQITDFYAVQNFLVELILSILVFFGILNTIGMSIYERIGEIGTLRALGDRRKDVLYLFFLEGFALGLAGSIIGIPLSALLSHSFVYMHIMFALPGSTQEIQLLIEPTMVDYALTSAILVSACLFSTFWPSFKATRLSIVDALRANS